MRMSSSLFTLPFDFLGGAIGKGSASVLDPPSTLDAHRGVLAWEVFGTASVTNS